MVSLEAQAEIQINLATDTLLTLSDAARRLPTKPSPATLWRWRNKGTNGVKFPVVRCGGRWITSVEAIAEFVRRQTPALAVSVEVRTTDTTQQLKAAGLL